MRVPVLLAMMIWLGAVSVNAAVYQWIDDKGVVNFTDDREKIPKKYREKAVERNLSDTRNVTIMKEDTPSVTPAVPTGSGQGLYGGRELRWWQTEFANVRKEIKQLEDDIPVKRQELSHLHRRRVLYQKASDRVALNKLNEEVEAEEARLRALQEKLGALTSEADQAGVPPEGR